LLVGPAQSQDCTPSWLPTFSGATGLSDIVEDLVVFDDGASGPALYAIGSFATAGSDGVNFIARWDGQSWSPLGTGLNSPSFALAGFDDGGGPALYAGGSFTLAGGAIAHRIAKWDGRSWSNLGSGMDNFVRVMCVFDDGSGNGAELYVGGEFTVAGGLTVNHVAKWNGTSWRALGSGTNDSVLALAVFDDGRGGGPALYAGGTFTEAGGIGAKHIARWDGSSWTALGGHGPDGAVFALADLGDLGGGPRLCAGGSFLNIGVVETPRIAVWDGSSWSTLGSGMNAAVHALEVFDDGSGGGPALFAGGSFTTADGASAKRIAKWDGTSWSALGGGMSGQVQALEVFDDGSGGGPALIAGGLFEQAFDSGDSYLAQWGCPASTSAWTDLGSGLAGISGVPALAGTGTLEPGSPGALALTNAQPTALTHLFVSFASTPAPFKGGVLVPVPSALILSLFTNGVGSIPLAWTAWPAGIPSASTLDFQYAIQDAAAPAGVALSNALRAITP